MVDIEADDADIACARMPKIRSGLVEEGFFAKQPGSGIDARGFNGNPSEAGRARFPVTESSGLAALSVPSERRLAGERAVEAGALAGMAGRTRRMNEREQRVGIAVVTQLHELLHVARGGALVP